jgi:sugar phosphate isomerase/epimerase
LRSSPLGGSPLAPKISVNLVAFPAETELPRALGEVRGLNVDGVTVPWQMIGDHVEAAHDALLDSGVSVSCLLATRFLTLADRSRWHQEQDRLAEVIDFARSVGCRYVYGTTGPRGRLSFDEATGELSAGLSPVLDHARSRDVQLLIESTNSLRTDYNYVFTLRDQIDVCRVTGLGMCVDLCACWAERDVEQLLETVAARASLVQISDFCIGTRTTAQRAVPGDGDMPLTQLLASLTRGGFDGWYDIEILGPRIDAEGPLNALRRAVRQLPELLPGISW